LIYEDFDLDLDNYSNPIKLAFREFETGTVLNEIRKEYNFLSNEIGVYTFQPVVGNENERGKNETAVIILALFPIAWITLLAHLESIINIITRIRR